MKEKNLYVDYKAQQHLYYVVKENNTYGPLISGSYLSKYFLDDFWQKKKNLERSLRQELQQDKISPVYYYMLLQELGEADLAARVKISKRKLRKHFKPRYFKKISLELLRRYANVFDVPVANLFQTLLIKDQDQEKIKVEQNKTQNPFYCTTKIKLSK